MITNE